jgi:hypothetical protein
VSIEVIFYGKGFSEAQYNIGLMYGGQSMQLKAVHLQEPIGM